MKTLAAVLLAVTLAPGVVRADTGGYPPPPARRLNDRGATMKKHGIAASVLGIIQLSIGMAAGLASIVPCHSDVSDGCGGNLVAFASGATFTALGAISASAGIPMWIYGAREERDANLTLSASATRLTLTF